MQDLTTGSLSRHLLKTASFMLIAMVFQTLYFLVDLYWVGSLGKEAVAGVSVSGNLFFVVLAITQMLGVGTTTLTSHAVGRKDHDRAHLVFNQALVLSVVMGIAYGGLAMALRGSYAQGLSADATTARLAGEYLLWFVPATALQFPLVAMGSALRGTGNFKPGMVVQIATVMLNMILAPFLIFGWGTGHALGVAGAAIATLVSVLVGTAWMLLFFRPPRSYLKIVPADWKPRFDLWRAMLSIGLPAGAEFALTSVYLLVVYLVTRPFGAEAQAGFGIGMRILQAGFMPVVALGFAVAPVAGQNFGARKASRVRATFRSALLMGATVMVGFTILCQLLPAEMMRVFTSDPRVIAVGVEYLRIISLAFTGSAVIFVGSSMFQAIGNTVPALISSSLRVVLVALPVFVLSRQSGFELRWVWILSALSVGIQMTVSLLLLRRELARRLAFEEGPPAHEPHEAVVAPSVSEETVVPASAPLPEVGES